MKCPTEIVVSDSQGRWSKLKPDGSNDVMKKGTCLGPNFLRYMERSQRPSGRAGMTTAEGQAKYAAGQEKALQRDVANLLRQRNIWFRQMPFGRKAPWVGWADFFLLLPDGKPFFIEVKTEEGEASQEQIDFAIGLPKPIHCNYRVVRNLTQLQSILHDHVKP